MSPSYYFYIITNPQKKVLYCGVTNDIWQRIIEHYLNRGQFKSFAGRYYCYNLIYYEKYDSIRDAIDREKEVKKWSRRKKEQLINEVNPGWKFLNSELFDYWPPDEEDLVSRDCD